jgi:hypothetical protein
MRSQNRQSKRYPGDYGPIRAQSASVTLGYNGAQRPPPESDGFSERVRLHAAVAASA